MGMPLDDPVVLAVEALLAAVGEPRSKRMFGGVGLYLDGLFVGVIDEGRVYLRAGDRNMADFDAVDAAWFDPLGKGVPMRYRELPGDLLDAPRRAKPWIEGALEAARDAAAAKGPKRRRTRPAGLSSVRNLGPVSRRMLADAGIPDRAALERAGAAAAFLAVERCGHAPTLNLLWAIEAGLANLPIGSVPEDVKRHLRRAVGRD